MTKTIWSAHDAASITNGWACCQWQASKITDVMRDVRRDTLFVASNAADAYEALAKRACAVMVSKTEAAKMRPHARLLVVENIDVAVVALARAARLRTAMKMIGVRDGEGQDALLAMTAHVLSNQGQVHVANHDDIWLAMAGTHAGTDFGLYAGDAGPLRPHFSINPVSCEIKAAGAVHRYGLDAGDARAVRVIPARNGSQVTADIMGQRIAYMLPVRGDNAVLYSLGVLLAVSLAGADVALAAKAFASLGRPDTESEDETNTLTLIDDSLLAPPTAVKASFKVMALIDPGRGGRRIAVLGGMLDINGTVRTGETAALPLKAGDIDLIYTSLDLLPRAANAGELAQIVPDALVPGDVVLVESAGEAAGRAADVRPRYRVEALRALPQAAKAGAKDNQPYAL